MKHQKIILFGIIGLTIFFLAFCIWGMRSIRFEAGLNMDVDGDTRYQAMLDAEQLLPQPNPIIVCLPVNGSALDSDTLGRLHELQEGIQAGLAAYPAWSLRSIFTVDLPRSEGQSLGFQRIDPAEGASAQIATAFEIFPSLKSLFCPKADAWFIFLYPPEKASYQEFLALDTALRAFPDVSAAGSAWLHFQSSRAMQRDLAIIIPILCSIILCYFLFIERAGLLSLLLVTATLLPAFGTMSFYPLFGFALKPSTVLAPILVLTLSTTYVIHVFHHFGREEKSYLSFLKSRGNIILWSGLSTILGFASLLLSPIPDLRTNGLFVILGMFMAFAWDLVALPFFVHSKRWLRDENFSQTPRRQPKPVVIISLSCLPFLFLLPGLAFVRSESLDIESFFTPRSEYAKNLRSFSSFQRIPRYIDLYVDTGREGGIADPGFFNQASEFTKELEIAPFVLSVYGYQEPIEETAHALGIKNGALSESGIAEILELLPVDEETPRFYDLGYRRVLFRVGVANFDGLSYQGIIDHVMDLAKYGFRGMDLTIAGSWPRYLLSNKALVRGQILGLVAYFFVLFALVFMRIKSLKKALLVCLAPAAAILSALGVVGYLGWGLTPTISLSVAALAGVCVDDAFIWCFFSHERGMRRSVLGTTVVICAGLSPLLLSMHTDLIRGGLIAIIGFILSCIFILGILPWKKPSQPSF